MHFPSLAERPEDFDGLIRHYLHKVAKHPDLTMHPSTTWILKNQNWQGNVRELHNVLAHLACLADQVITPDLLPYYIDRNAEPIQTESGGSGDEPEDSEWHALAAQIESNAFMNEVRAVLDIYLDGKRHNRSFGRMVVCEELANRGISLSPQQLRLRQQRLNDMGLLRVRRGRAGTTISSKGERFVDYLNRLRPEESAE